MKESLVYKASLPRHFQANRTTPRRPVMPGRSAPCFTGILAALLAVPLTLPAVADPLSPVRTAELSARLYAAGVALADPVLILAAAKLRKTLDPVPTDRTADGASAVSGTPLDWHDMLAQAAPLAAGDAGLEGVIADVRAETGKGASSGPVYSIGTLRSGAVDIYPVVEFLGGDYAEVYVEPTGDTDLNLTVIDGMGRLICADTEVSPIAYCGWRPLDTGSFVLRVVNHGPLSTTYALMTN